LSTDAHQEPGATVPNRCIVDALDRLIARVAAEQDDVLRSIQLCGQDPALVDRLWAQLVDLLVEATFLDLRRRHLLGAEAPGTCARELADTAARCRAVGLLPLGAPKRPA